MEHINLAIQRANTLPKQRGKQRICAIGFDKKGNVISSGFNSYELTHPMQYKYAKAVGLEEKCFLHAELSCIIKAKGQAIHKIVVARVGADGQPRLAAPCPICNLAIRQAGIKVVEYTV